MKTFLAQNEFISNSTANQPPAVEQVVASRPDASAELAAIDSCQEPVAADITSNSGASQPRGEPAPTTATQPAGSPNISTNFIGHLIHHASLLRLPRFVPDQDAVGAAMHDENAPRALATDPVWADEAPLFLRMAI